MRKLDEIADLASAFSSKTVMSKSAFDYARHNLTVDQQVMSMVLLFPQVIKYRGGIFLKDRFDKYTCDEWFIQYEDQVSVIERAVNFIDLSDYVLDDGHSYFSLRDLVSIFRLAWATWLPQVSGKFIDVQAISEDSIASITFSSLHVEEEDKSCRS